MWQYVSCIIDGGMSADDNVLHALPLYHCAQLDVFLGPAIYLGATSLITGKPVADNILALISAHRINAFFAPPTIWIAMLRSPNFDATDLSTLQKGYYGASIMSVGPRSRGQVLGGTMGATRRSCLRVGRQPERACCGTSGKKRVGRTT